MSVRWFGVAASVLAFIVVGAPQALAVENGMARTPPMGWASWNTFAGNVEDSLFRAQADAIVQSGLRDAGYEYVIIDEPGFKRGASGELQADASKFPEGVKPLVDYIHSKGLKAGIYTTRGKSTCLNLGYAGVQGFETQDAKQFAAWGFDYVKDDDCDGNAPSPQDAKMQYEKFRDALATSGRPMVYSLVTWWTESAPFGADTGNLWRIAGDIRACWTCAQGVRGGTNGVLDLIDRDLPLAGAARPGAWNDPDMLEVGVSVAGYPGLTPQENRAHFAMWAMLASPLLAGNDLTTMTDDVRDILVNHELIAIDQDTLGFQAVKVRSERGLEVWVKPLSGGGARAVALFNRSNASETISVRWSEVALSAMPSTARNVSRGVDLGILQEGLEAVVPAHGVEVFRVDGHPFDIEGTDLTVSAMKPAYAANYWGPVEIDRSNGEQGFADGRLLSIGGQSAPTGLGVSAPSRIAYELRSQCTKLTALTGVDDETAGKGSVVFEVYGDGNRLYRGDTLRGNAPAVSIDVDVAGVDLLELVVKGGGDSFDYDHADWLDAKLQCHTVAPGVGLGGGANSGGEALGGSALAQGGQSGAASASAGAPPDVAGGRAQLPGMTHGMPRVDSGGSCRVKPGTHAPEGGASVVLGAMGVAMVVIRRLLATAPRPPGTCERSVGRADAARPRRSERCRRAQSRTRTPRQNVSRLWRFARALG